jgi:hypothetical protein
LLSGIMRNQITYASSHSNCFYVGVYLMVVNFTFSDSMNFLISSRGPKSRVGL